MAGGMSERMGSDKARLPFGDKSLIEYMAERFARCFDRVYISARNRESLSGLDIGFPIIEDEVQGIGPMGGIYSALKNTGADRLFFVSVDMPFAKPKAAARLFDMADGDIAVVERNDGRHESLFAVYGKACLGEIEACLADKQYALRKLFERVQTRYVSEKELFVDPDICFFNMNRRTDYYRALEMLGALGVSGDAGEKAGEIPEIPAVSFVAKSGTGKTTYIEALVRFLKEKGLNVAVIKHDAHGFEIDKPGKDSYRFSHAGADTVLLSSGEKTAVVLRHEAAPKLEDMIKWAERSGADIIITEGYKHENLPKIEVLRKGYSEEFVSDAHERIAVVADFEVDTKLPVFSLNEPEEIVDFILSLKKM